MNICSCVVVPFAHECDENGWCLLQELAALSVAAEILAKAEEIANIVLESGACVCGNPNCPNAELLADPIQVGVLLIELLDASILGEMGHDGFDDDFDPWGYGFFGLEDVGNDMDDLDDWEDSRVENLVQDFYEEAIESFLRSRISDSRGVIYVPVEQLIWIMPEPMIDEAPSLASIQAPRVDSALRHHGRPDHLADLFRKARRSIPQRR